MSQLELGVCGQAHKAIIKFVECNANYRLVKYNTIFDCNISITCKKKKLNLFFFLYEVDEYTSCVMDSVLPMKTVLRHILPAS